MCRYELHLFVTQWLHLVGQPGEHDYVVILYENRQVNGQSMTPYDLKLCTLQYQLQFHASAYLLVLSRKRRASELSVFAGFLTKWDSLYRLQFTNAGT